MSDVAVMAALIEQNAYGTYKIGGIADYMARCTPGSAEDTAKALYGAGFRMVADGADAALIKRLRAIEDRLTRVEGYAGIPPHYVTPGGQ